MKLQEDLVTHSAEVLGQRFLMLIQALSGIRGLTSLEVNNMEEFELLDQVLSVLIQNLDMDRCSVFLLEGDRLCCAAGKDWNDYVQRDQNKIRCQYHTFKIGEGAIGLAAKNRRLYHSHNCKADDNFVPIINSNASKNSGSLICAPIMIGQELMGVLNISHPQPDFFHAWQEHVVVIHANLLAQLLYNHRMMKNIRDEVKKRTRELETALAEAEDLKLQYETLSFEDELTKLHNRRYFFVEACRALSEAMRYSHPLSMLLLDVDNFKQINDHYGHDSGDKVLKDIGSLLKGQVRGGDIVARIGGEEFVFILTNTGINGANKCAQRVREAIADMSWYDKDERFKITISIGISTLNNRHDKTEDMLAKLLKESDKALYQCKTSGRDNVVIFAEEEKETHN